MPKHKADKHKSRHEWSDWIWSAELNLYYHVRQKSNGEWVYEDQNGQPLETPHEDPATPRDAPVEDLTERFASISTNTGDEYPVDDYGQASASDQPSYSYTGARNEPVGDELGRRRRGKGKDKHRHVSYEDTPGQDDLYEPHDENIYEPSSGSAYAPTAGYGSYGAVDDPELEQVLDESRRYQQSYHPGGASSSGAYAPLDIHEEDGVQPGQAEDTPTIRGYGKLGDKETLDKRYKIHASKKFKPGEVFKVLWPEPMGAMPGAPTISDRGALKDRFGGMVHVGFRRFIVIATDEGHSTCVPILTYGDQACKKRGVKPHHHGVIYTSSKPRMLDGEPDLGAPPTKMDVTESGEKLSRSSRVNYSKMMTIEHNVKVFFIGRIAPADYHIVFDAVNRCWEAKEHHRQRDYEQNTG